MHAASICEIGIPVRSVNWVRLHPGTTSDGTTCLYAVMGQQAAGLFVLQIDLESGACRQFTAEQAEANYPTATYMSSTGRLYIGSAYAGHLLCFDPIQDALIDLGAIHPQAATFPCRIDEDEHGCLWIGSYPKADLTMYDPRTGVFERHGSMDEEDMYNYPLVDRDGSIANLVRMTKPHVVRYDPATGNKTIVGPVSIKGESDLNLMRGSDGALYIASTLGDFCIDEGRAIAVERLPEAQPAATLPDGSRFAFADAKQQRYMTLILSQPDGSERRIELSYEASGSRIFYVHRGPDDCIYGSSILPLHLFRFSPKSRDLVDLGVCSTSTGEAYSMANLNGKMYIASYPQARLSVYDPSQDYCFGEEIDHNPRDLGRMDDLSYRPRSTLTGPLGRVWTASVPDYGRWGGPLSWYDPEYDTRSAHMDICGDASCYTMAWLERDERIAVGTTIHGGSGTQPRVERAALFLWDYRSNKKTWEQSVEHTTINALIAGPDERLYGTVTGGSGSALFVFDPRALEFTHFLQVPDDAPLDLGLQTGPDGNLYGFSRSTIYRLDPQSLRIDPIVEKENGFTVAGPILGNRIFFAHEHRLCAATIS